MMSSISKRIRTSAMVCSLLASSVFLSSCGGGGAAALAGIGGTGIVFGPIVAFGSVWVNGVRYEIDTAEIEVDEAGGLSQSDLRLGMMVKLEVETENGIFTNKATRVIYDDEVEGPLTNIVPDDPLNPTLKTGQIFGQTVTFSDTTTVYENTTFETLGLTGGGADDVLEVSGFRTTTGIIATYVRFDGDLIPGITEVELRGSIQALAGAPPIESFQIGTTSVNTSGSTIIGFPLANDLYVEVKGVIENDSSVTALRIEQEDENFDDDVDDISLQGVVAGFTDINSDFFIGSQRVNASSAQLSPLSLILMDGMKVEVEGEIAGGTLIADEVEARDSDTKLRSYVDNVNLTAKTFDVTYSAVPGAVTVHIDDSTLFEDDTGAPVTTPFSLDDLLNGNLDFVRVEGIEIANDEVLATYVRRTTADSSLRLEGQVDDFFPGSFIRVLGVNYGVDLSTSYDPSSAAVVPGVFVEIEDERIGGVNPPGTADKVELD